MMKQLQFFWVNNVMLLQFFRGKNALSVQLFRGNLLILHWAALVAAVAFLAAAAVRNMIYFQARADLIGCFNIFDNSLAAPLGRAGIFWRYDPAYHAYQR
jgi:hypothetical protein